MSASVISIDNNKCGFLDIIIGPMFSGKTNFLLKEICIFSTMGANVLYINHSLDNRSNKDFSIHSTHNTYNIDNIDNIKTIKTDALDDSLKKLCENFLVIAIDEAQFFTGLKDFVLFLVENMGKRVIVAGLNGDYKRETFGEITNLISYCDRITKLSSFCKSCAIDKKIKEAHFSYRMNDDSNNILVGGKDEYIPLCRECYLYKKI